VIFQAGSSEDGRNFAARHAEAIFTHQENIPEAQAFYADIKARARGFGRNPDQLYIVPGARPIMAGTEEEAQRLHEELAGLVSLETPCARWAVRSTITISAFTIPMAPSRWKWRRKASNRTSPPRSASSIWPNRG
jgi:alkanesulfonate monooxygenase SsuD/methylene tetrahydromethanopterin reductase-like flavin-dependent oxidoreductase (luciferase family)